MSKSDKLKRVRTRCFFDIAIDRKAAGRIVFELFDDVCPKTCENFRCLSTGERGTGKMTGKPLHYKGVLFHRVVRNFMIQAGDFSSGNGKGGESIYGGPFQDENFTIPHDQPFLLSMANRGKNTNGSQFFITTKAAPHLDGKHVVFGHVLTGQEVVREIESLQTDKMNRPRLDVEIANCGELVPQLKSKNKIKDARESRKAVKDHKEKKKRRRSHSSIDSSTSSDSSDSETSSSSSGDSTSSSDSSSDESRKKRKRKSSKKKQSKKSKKSSKKHQNDELMETNIKKVKSNEIETNGKATAEIVKPETNPIDPNCSVRPEEIPEVPVNKFLLRDDVQKANSDEPTRRSRRDDIYKRRMERRMNQDASTRSGRKIKGRGAMRYRTPSPTERRSGSETPPHWKTAQSRLKSIEDVISRQSTRDRDRERKDHPREREKSERRPDWRRRSDPKADELQSSRRRDSRSDPKAGEEKYIRNRESRGSPAHEKHDLVDRKWNRSANRSEDGLELRKRRSSSDRRSRSLSQNEKSDRPKHREKDRRRSSGDSKFIDTKDNSRLSGRGDEKNDLNSTYIKKHSKNGSAIKIKEESCGQQESRILYSNVRKTYSVSSDSDSAASIDEYRKRKTQRRRH